MTKTNDLIAALTARSDALEADSCKCTSCIARREYEKSEADKRIAFDILALEPVAALDAIVALPETKRPIGLSKFDGGDLIKLALACGDSQVLLRRKLVGSMKVPDRQMYEFHLADRAGRLPRHVRIMRAGTIEFAADLVDRGILVRIPARKIEVTAVIAARLRAA